MAALATAPQLTTPRAAATGPRGARCAAAAAAAPRPAVLSSRSSGFAAPAPLRQRAGGAIAVRAAAGPVRVQAARFPTERTYVMIKPDGVQRGLVGEIIGRFEKKGFVLKGLKLFNCSKALAEEHYKDLKEKPFFPDLVGYIISGPVCCMLWEGPAVIASARKLIGATNPAAAEPGTIRGDLSVEVGRNVVHGSDSAESAEREIKLWFQEAELLTWTPAMMPWLRE